jgi:hypothetical protein
MVYIKWLSVLLVAGVCIGLLTDTPSCVRADDSCDAACLQLQRNALLDLYASTGGAYWFNNSGWSSSTWMCSWFGIVCCNTEFSNLAQVHIKSRKCSDTSTQAVIAVFLPANNLTGTVPPSLSSLRSLRGLFLTLNSLRGSIPTSLFTLQQLHFMMLSENQLTGSIAPEISTMKALENLYLNKNVLTGSIPDTLSVLTLLTYVDISSNRLTSSIPDSIWSISSLQVLNLDRNRLTGTLPQKPDFLPGGALPLPALKVLDIHDNALQGQLPDWLPLMPIISFALGQNQFSGTLSPSLTCAPLVQHLHVEANRLTGTIPDFCFGSLETLRIGGNLLTGSVPWNLGYMDSLWSISLSENFGLTGTLPPTFSRMDNLRYLDVMQTSMSRDETGPLPLFLEFIRIWPICDTWTSCKPA